MQLTNILRDVGEDAQMGRIYLPAEDMRRFGYSEQSLLEGRIDDAFVALMQFQIARVRELYAAAEPGIVMLNSDSRYTVRLAYTLYSRILNEIEANRYDVFTKRAFVPLRSKLVGALNLALSALATGPEDPPSSASRSTGYNAGNPPLLASGHEADRRLQTFTF